MRLYHFTLALLSLVFVCSCSKDLGNYTYKEINELNIAGVNDEYTIRTGIDTLKVNPIIKATKDESDTSRYSYLWVIQTGPKTRDTISQRKNLTYPVKLVPALYSIYYRVMDKETGVTWVANTKVNVTTAFSKGLLIMGENEQGNAEAEMLSMTTTPTVHVKGILSSSGLPVLRDPISFVHTGGSTAVKLWVFTKSGSYFLDRAALTGTDKDVFSKSLYASENIDPATLNPVLLAPQINSLAGGISSGSYRVMVSKGGDVFVAIPPFYGDSFVNPINRIIAGGPRFTAAPYLLYPIGAMNSVIWYDTQNQRFLNYTNFTGPASTVLADAPGDIFPWNQPSGRTLVYAENTRNNQDGVNGNSYTIMKDANNTHHIYKFYANGAKPVKLGMYTIKPLATDFDKAKFYAFSSNRSVVFYAIGNRLYAYDFNPGKEKLYSFPEITDEISMIKFDTQMDHVTNALYIATYNSTTKGTLRSFKVGNDPNFVDLIPKENSTWTDLIKVKDVNWRATN